MSKPLLTIPNRHTDDCGHPPNIVDDDPDVYIGYFANAYGEQWVFQYNRASRQGSLRGGDAGWDEVHEVRDGVAAGLILSRDEALWLAACWSAATQLS